MSHDFNCDYCNVTKRYYSYCENCKKYACSECLKRHDDTCLDSLVKHKNVTEEGINKLKEQIEITINKFNIQDKIDEVNKIIKYFDSKEFENQDALVKSLILKSTNREDLFTKFKELKNLSYSLETKYTKNMAEENEIIRNLDKKVDNVKINKDKILEAYEICKHLNYNESDVLSYLLNNKKHNTKIRDIFIKYIEPKNNNYES
jgi:hypothetical protein